MRHQIKSTVCCSILILAILLVQSVQAEPVDQSFNFNPGWNAIFLEVDPVDPDPAVVFATLPELTSIWMWNPQSGTVEFIQDPNTMEEEQSEMLSYIPGHEALNNLHAIRGNHAYLVQISGAATITDFIIHGEPLVPNIEWKPNSFNFVGFHLPGNHGDAGPLFDDFFAASPAHAGQEIYTLVNNGWELQTLASVRRGEAFWVYCHGSSEFSGPVIVQLGTGNVLDYGDILDKQNITLHNESDDDRIISLSLTDGLNPATFPLFYWKFDPTTNSAVWVPVPSVPDSYDVMLAAGETEQIALGVKRVGLNEVDYTANILVADALQAQPTTPITTFKLPVTVTGISYSGLWIGDAIINKVNQPAQLVDSGVVKPTGSTFPYRLIFHVDADGQARLLNQVIQMWDENTGKYVLLADDALIPYYSGASLRDGQPVGRRISSPAFGNFYSADDTTAFVGDQEQVVFEILIPVNGFASQGAVLTATLFLPKEDPSNPFVHKFHPDHPAAAGRDIIREISLEFTDTDADGNSLIGAGSLGWGSSELGGIYRETFKGLLRSTYDINIEGPFILHRVSKIDTLTTAAPAP